MSGQVARIPARNATPSATISRIDTYLLNVYLISLKKSLLIAFLIKISIPHFIFSPSNGSSTFYYNKEYHRIQ